jgi:hypothetical protein
MRIAGAVVCLAWAVTVAMGCLAGVLGLCRSRFTRAGGDGGCNVPSATSALAEICDGGPKA